MGAGSLGLVALDVAARSSVNKESLDTRLGSAGLRLESSWLGSGSHSDFSKRFNELRWFHELFTILAPINIVPFIALIRRSCRLE